MAQSRAEIHNAADCERFLGNAISKRIANNTTVERTTFDGIDGCFAVRFHDTDIVTYLPDGSVRFDSGGWSGSPTTRARFNQFGPKGLRFSSVRGVVVVDDLATGDSLAFFDGLEITSADPADVNRRLLALDPGTPVWERWERKLAKLAADNRVANR